MSSGHFVKTKRIGILGGSSDQATTAYYQQLNALTRQRLGGWNTAELIMTSLNFAFSEDCVRNERWDDMGDYLADRARALEAGGADFYLCVSNTLHRTAPRFQTAVTIPFLHIADPTGEAIRAAGLRKVALLGTKMVMSSDFLRQRYRERFNLEIVVPSPQEIDYIDRIIFDELCVGQFTEPSRQAYLNIVDRLHGAGAEGVILGCTEIPLLISQPDRHGIPMFDTMALHVAAAVDLAIG